MSGITYEVFLYDKFGILNDRFWIASEQNLQEGDLILCQSSKLKVKGFGPEKKIVAEFIEEELINVRITKKEEK